MSKVDWDSCKADYRTGKFSNVVLGKKYGVSNVAIWKRAKKEVWPRDLASAVQQATKDALVRASVRAVRAANALTDEEVIAAATQENVAIVRLHRRDVRQMSELVELLRDQALAAATHRGSLGKIIDANTPATHHQKRAAMLKAVSLPAHAGVIRDLTTAAKNLITLERQAFNIGQEDGDGGSLEDWLAKLEP